MKCEKNEGEEFGIHLFSLIEVINNIHHKECSTTLPLNKHYSGGYSTSFSEICQPMVHHLLPSNRQ